MANQTSSYLIEEFNKRSKKNERYSLRAFARDIEIAPSHLSTLLKDKSGLSKERAFKIAQKLELSPRKTKIFVETAESEYSRSSILKEAAKKRVRKIYIKQEIKEHLEVDEFQFISQWYHLAILELFELKDFKMNNGYISSKLGITEKEVQEAIVRLVRLKLLVTRKGKLIPNEESTMVGDNVSSSAIRQFHEQIIQKAKVAIHDQDKSERILRSSIITIKKDKVQEALLMLQDFHNKFCVQIGEQQIVNKDEVYCLSSQFFKLTN
ncbi:MAG: DUF4423 domain-containing protein [Bdellovibrionales bacterium]|nr:DUF4423 domain-containing protein [Bdellovibrionales bacterium]